MNPITAYLSGSLDPSGCNPREPDGELVGPIVSAPVPWVKDWVVEDKVKRFFPTTTPGVPKESQASLLAPRPLPDCRYFWHIEMQAREKLGLRSQESEICAEQGFFSNAQISSYLKVQIEWGFTRTSKRTIVCDLGDGLDVTVGPSNYVCAKLVHPRRDASFDLPSAPIDFTPYSDYSTYTRIATRATPTLSCCPFRGRFTQSCLFVDPGPVTQDIFIPAGAAFVQIYETDFTTNPVAVPAVGEWIFDVSVAALPAIPLGNLTSTLGAGVSEAIGGESAFVVPQNAKVLRLTLPSPMQRLVTAVFILHF